MILLIYLIRDSLLYAAVERDFKNISIKDGQLLLAYQPAKEKYILYNVDNGWLIINKTFLDDMHLKIVRCDEKEKIVEPVVKSILEPKISWYQEKDIVLFGFPLTLASGFILALLVK